MYSSRRSLQNLKDSLRNCDIHQLNALEKADNKQLSHFLGTVSAQDLTTDIGLNRARQIIKSEKSTKLMPQLYSDTSVSVQKRGETTVTNQKRMSATDTKLIQNFRSPDAQSIFDINITRLTHTIAATLYVALFGPLDRESDYNQVISDLNPGLTWLVEQTTNKRGLKFTFNDGANTDIVTVECAQVAYVNLLRACQGSILNFEQQKMNISDVTAQTEFAASIYIITNSLFGKLEKDSFTPNQFKTDLQNQNDIRIFTMDWTLSQESCLAFPMVDGFAALAVNLTAFVKSYSTSR